MKEYSLQEIFDLPEGTEFINADAHFEVMNGVLYNWFKPKDKQSVRLTKMYVNMKFMKVQQPVSFVEAITSNKRIKVDVTELNEKYGDGSHVLLNSYWNNVYFTIDAILSMLGEGDHYRNRIIKEGKWYVEEGFDSNAKSN